MVFKGTKVEPLGESDYRVIGELTLRGVRRETTLDVHYLGQWPTPYCGKMALRKDPGSEPDLSRPQLSTDTTLA